MISQDKINELRADLAIAKEKLEDLGYRYCKHCGSWEHEREMWTEEVCIDCHEDMEI